MHSSGSFMRQLSRKEGCKFTSRRWGEGDDSGSSFEANLTQMEEELNMNVNGVVDHNGLQVLKKRVMVVVDQSSHSKHVMMWALTHVANKGDLLTLLHVIPPSQKSCKPSSCSTHLANSLGSLCKAYNPQVEVEAVVIQGPKLETVLNQVKKLEISVLVLSQKRPSPFLNCVSSSRTEEFVEQCINNAECLTIGVRKQSKGVGGYLISTRCQKNFWLLA
ncbi:UDP-galactose transporter 1-like [Hibiscus syriacus]|uniref:UDP-galactose transporter 1-like n=1 Tax=Hibiscus syriacus TaxID=106335 RepID=A0A6A2X679_HIBSY|nr:uncharacterized protein LOC120198099 [Hibiscus syriacus]KAE8653869.1 UDP-galactose transporter 1-like [Hibiscus syriacus]